MRRLRTNHQLKTTAPLIERPERPGPESGRILGQAIGCCVAEDSSWWKDARRVPWLISRLPSDGPAQADRAIWARRFVYSNRTDWSRPLSAYSKPPLSSSRGHRAPSAARDVHGPLPQMPMLSSARARMEFPIRRERPRTSLLLVTMGIEEAQARPTIATKLRASTPDETGHFRQVSFFSLAKHALPERWVTVYSEDMGNTLGLCRGKAKCPVPMVGARGFEPPTT